MAGQRRGVRGKVFRARHPADRHDGQYVVGTYLVLNQAVVPATDLGLFRVAVQRRRPLHRHDTHLLYRGAVHIGAVVVRPGDIRRFPVHPYGVALTLYQRLSVAAGFRFVLGGSFQDPGAYAANGYSQASRPFLYPGRERRRIYHLSDHRYYRLFHRADRRRLDHPGRRQQRYARDECGGEQGSCDGRRYRRGRRWKYSGPLIG